MEDCVRDWLEIKEKQYEEEDDNISDEAQDAYVSRNSSLWRKGMVAYKFEKYHGGNLYSDEDMRFIKDAMNQIIEQVPCIVFK